MRQIHKAVLLTGAVFKPIMECQVVVVGDAKVGKTALIRRLTQNEFFEVMTHRNLELTRANRSVDQYARSS